MNILVTGGTGFVGSCLIGSLLKQSDIKSIGILHRQNSDLSEIENLNLDLSKLNYFVGDITDKDSLLKATLGIDTVFHLAGLVAYKKSERHKMDLVNVQGTQNMIDACLKNHVRRLVHMSSVTAIGASFTPSSLNEDSPYNIEHLNLGYFETKHRAEKLVYNAVLRHGLNSVIVNPSTIYGPGDARKGSRKTQLKVAQGNFPFYTSGGVNVIAIEDVCQGLISAWRNGLSGERYILAGENLLIKDLFKLIAKEAGTPAPFIPLPKPLTHFLGFVGDQVEKLGKETSISSENAWTSQLFHWFDSKKAQEHLGLKPKSAQYAIAQSVQWMRDNQLID